MSTPTAESGVHLGPAAFAAAVRAQLHDLPADVVEELTDGLEADLAETAAERGSEDLEAVLGSPVAYATELRASAGLPPAAAGRRFSSGISKAALRAWWATKDREWQRHSWWVPVRDAVASLRPAWWIGRAVLVTSVPFVLLGLVGRGWWLLGLAVIVASIALGRGWLQGQAGGRALVTGVNVLAALTIPLFLGWVSATAWSPRHVETPDAPYSAPQSLTYEGSDVTNIFAYDAAGKPIPVVQLFDQDGRPLTLNPDVAASNYDIQGLVTAFPHTSTQGAHDGVWNAFPIWNAVQDSLDEPAVPLPPNAPHVSVAPVVPPSSADATAVNPGWPAPGPSASTSVTPSVSPGATPGARTTASPSSSAAASPTPTRTSR